MRRHSKKRIMLVDDDTHLLVTLTDYLQSEGFDVSRAENGREALDQLDKVRPDLIILDIGMPEMNGLAFLKEISVGGGKPRYPVLVFTAKAAMETFFSDIAIEGFIPKPCAESQLLKTIHSVFDRREPRANGAKRRRRVLLAESSRDHGEKLARSFEEAGCDVELVQTGPQVMESAALQAPDVIVMKDSLPEVTGTAMAAMISALPALKLVPIVVYDSPGGSSQLRIFHGDPPRGVSKYLLSDKFDVLQRAVEDVCSA